MKTSIVVAIVLVCAFGVVQLYRQMEPATPMQIYWKKNRSTITEYLQSAKAPVVFTGSSVTATLDFNETAQCAYNLGLIGESALTGLDVIAGTARKPRTVFIEINFPGRDSNKYLINTASGFLASNFPEFIYTAPINLAGNWLSSAYHYLRDKPGPGQSVASEQDPKAVRSRELALNRASVEIPLPAIAFAAQMSAYKAKVKDFEQKGMNVIFFEMPVHPELKDSNQAIQARSAFRAAFPDHKFLDSGELAKGAIIDPADGLHLNVEGAKGVLVNLKRFYENDCEVNAPRHP